MELTDKQKRQLAILAELADGGDLTVMQRFLDMQDSLEVTSDEVTAIRDEVKGIKDDISSEIQVVAEMKQRIPQKGDKGDTGQSIEGKSGRDGKDGRDGHDGVNGRDGLDGRDGKDGTIGNDGSPDTPDQVVEKVNSSDLLIKKERIEGLIDLMMHAAANAVASVGITTTNFFKDGTLVGRAKNINFVEGSNVTLGVQVQGDQANVTINSTSSGGGTFSFEIPTGTVNGSNTSFTVTNTPVWISIDGLNKFPTLNYTYSAGTITVTDGAPPVFSIYSFHN